MDLRKRISLALNALLLVGMATSAGIAFAEVGTATLSAHPCESLHCTAQPDCGSGPTPPCFCNNPLGQPDGGTCYPNA